MEILAVDDHNLLRCQSHKTQENKKSSYENCVFWKFWMHV